MDLEDVGGFSYLKILEIYLNLSIFIVSKSGPSIINSIFNEMI